MKVYAQQCENGMSRFAYALTKEIKHWNGVAPFKPGWATRADMRFRASLIISGEYCTEQFVNFEGVL